MVCMVSNQMADAGKPFSTAAAGYFPTIAGLAPPLEFFLLLLSGLAGHVFTDDLSE